MEAAEVSLVTVARVAAAIPDGDAAEKERVTA